MIFLALLVSMLVLPFIGKAFNIDDPLFIWTAQHIQANPGNPYGFSVNWYGWDRPMSIINKNPPLASYYIALAASVFGWSESALHLTFLLPALAVAIGMYLIARRFCEHPLLAALAGLLTPVYLMTGLTVMSDMLMLAFWVFAVYFWIDGMETGKPPALALAGLLIGIAALTKYFAIALIPLLGFYSVTKQRRVGLSLLYLLIPVVLLAWYQWATYQLYGRGLLLDAAAYATNIRPVFNQGPVLKLYIGLAFTGGCIASALFFARQMWSSTALALGALTAMLSAVVITSFSTLTGRYGSALAHWPLALQLAIWGTAGASLLMVAALDLHRQRDADSLFLFLWLIGTFVFAGFINWTTNGRSILPMIVPAGIIITRLLEQRATSRRPGRLPAPIMPLAAAVALTLAVSWADFTFAEVGRTGARLIQEKYAASADNAWFEGHWGFQYYMQQRGAKALEVKRTVDFGRRDILAVPTTNTNVYPIAPGSTRLETVDVPVCGWLATMNSGAGAGFYSDFLGPLPFAFWPIPAERFKIFSALPARARN
jgi:4-amino-4-deoxy-L-arabinose transferase-like glycosyltransferase